MAAELTDFIGINDLVSFPGQVYCAGLIAEISKRAAPTMPDSWNRGIIMAGALVVNFVIRLAVGGVPTGSIAWSANLLLCVMNGFGVALVTMKSIESISERKVREIATEMAASGVQVTTNITKGPKPPAGSPAPEPAPMATLATEPAQPSPAAPVAPAVLTPTPPPWPPATPGSPR
jgi:hypothetical protein